jgi:hypothetical protein
MLIPTQFILALTATTVPERWPPVGTELVVWKRFAVRESTKSPFLLTIGIALPLDK